MLISQGSVRRAAVIGAGVCGITAAKCLLDEGIEPVVFERGHQIGGLWTFDEQSPDGGGPAYRSLHTNTIRPITAYSDFPLPDDLPELPARADIERYLNAYADHFGVRKHVCFGTLVEAVMPIADGRWVVRASGMPEQIFDAVLVCSGVFNVPILPRFPGIETFSGTLLHSRAYTVPEPFADQDVVVVGVGSSGNDIAIELSRVARQTSLSARSVNWAAALDRSTQPTGSDRMQRFRQASRRPMTRLRRHARLTWRQMIGRKHGVEPDAPFELGAAPLSLKPALLDRIRSGSVIPRPQIAQIEADCVVFGDGSRVHADTIIAATGYAVEFPFLAPEIVPMSRDGLPLYRLVFPPDHPTLAFIGMFRVTGPVPPVAEMQARWAARVLRGRVRLPAPDVMRAAITARMALIARTGGNPFRLDFEAYLDLLAAEIGVLPRLWRHPRLWHALLLGPPVAAQYRLDGRDHRRNIARSILTAKRVRTARKA